MEHLRGCTQGRGGTGKCVCVGGGGTYDLIIYICRILTSLSLGGSYPRLLGCEKLWTTASFPYLGAGRTQLQPMRSRYFSRTSDVTLGDYGRAVGRSL